MCDQHPNGNQAKRDRLRQIGQQVAAEWLTQHNANQPEENVDQGREQGERRDKQKAKEVDPPHQRAAFGNAFLAGRGCRALYLPPAYCPDRQAYNQSRAKPR